MDVGVASKSCKFQIIPTLLDSRANATFIDKAIAEWLGLMLEALTNPICVFNVDRSHNSAGDITHAVNIQLTFSDIGRNFTPKLPTSGKTLLS